MVDSIRGVDGGEVILYYSLLDQAYFLPPLLLMILIYTHLKGRVAVDEEITKWQPELLKSKKSIRSKIKSTKELKQLLLVTILLFLLSFTTFAFANQNEDNQNQVINLNSKTDYTNINIYAFSENAQNLEIFGFAHSTNQYGRLFPHLMKFTYDPNSEKVIDSNRLLDIPPGETIIKTAISNNEFYFSRIYNEKQSYHSCRWLR